MREDRSALDRPREAHDSETFPACFCGADTYRLVLRGRYDRLSSRAYGFAVARCLRCGLARTLPVPDPMQYRAGYELTTDQGRFTGSDRDAWSEPLAAYVRVRCSGKRLLDVGCHVGNLVAAAASHGFEAEGIDLDPVATAEGQRLGRPVHAASVHDIDGRFDAVVLNHVLEHVLDLRAFVARLAELLVPGGRLFVFVPNHAGLLPRLMRERWIGWFPSQHVWHFRPATLAGALEDAAGLRLLECTTKGVIEPPSKGVKGVAKAGLSILSRWAGWGDQIEAVFVKAEEEPADA